MEAKAYEQEGLINYLQQLAGIEGERQESEMDRGMIAKVEKTGAEIRAFYNKTVEPLFKEMQFEELLGRVQRTYDSYY